MKKKNHRFQIIRNLITQKEIISQEELLNSLQDLGIIITQATLSRDLRELKISKSPNEEGVYTYKIIDNNHTISNIQEHHELVDLSFSHNIAVITTTPGYANRIAFEIDRARFPSILGTVAGDDTIIVITKEESKREQVINELINIIPNINLHSNE